MKVLVFAGVISAACAGSALATPLAATGEMEEVRREAQERRVETPPPQAERPTAAARPEEQTRSGAQRRRYGKPIPDAELIGPRAVL